MNIHHLSKKFRHLQSHSFRRILALCTKSEVVSFDVFDTLLFRRVDSAKDIFCLMEEQLQIPAFCQKRVAANEKIRRPEYHRNQDNCTDEASEHSEAVTATLPEDFTLREIYDYYEGLSDKERDRFTELECALEIANCEPRPDVKAVFDACLRMDKPILLISDMYLPRECITAMLDKCGYQGYTALYISGEEGELKLTGNLFRTILKRTGISARSQLHIGDNLVSDFLRPKQLGIRAVKIKALTASHKQRILSEAQKFTHS